MVSGPVKIVALGPARPFGLRSCGCEVPLHWAVGTLAFVSVAAPRPCDAPGHGPTDCLRQGVRFGLGRATFGAAKAPRFGSETYLVRGIWRGAEERCFAVNPERPEGVRGQNRNLSLISVAERNQHRHSMTPGRLAAVKDRGCPPILACCGYRLASKNRLPPRPLAKRRQRVRAAVPDCLTPASFRWASFISVMRDNSFWRLS